VFKFDDLWDVCENGVENQKHMTLKLDVRFACDCTTAYKDNYECMHTRLGEVGATM
jgi:hypothetical protein